MGQVSVTVPTETTRTTRYTPKPEPIRPPRVTLPVQLTFCPVSSLSSQPRACRSSTNGWVQLPAGRGHGSERLGSTPSRAQHAHARALAPPAPPESRFPTRDLAPLFPDRARALGDYHHRPVPKLAAARAAVRAGAAGARLVRDEQGEPAGAPLEPRSRSLSCSLNYDRRNHTRYALSRRACAFVCESRIIKDRGSRSCLRRALLPVPHAERCSSAQLRRRHPPPPAQPVMVRC